MEICDRCYYDNLYEFCPINDKVLIICLKDIRIKMSKSGKYENINYTFVVSEYRNTCVYIYSYGNQITFIIKIKNVRP